jgi:hypothetical protein
MLELINVVSTNVLAFLTIVIEWLEPVHFTAFLHYICKACNTITVPKLSTNKTSQYVYLGKAKTKEIKAK